MFDSNSKPLPLKQRTSSVDNRRDYSVHTWWSLRELIKLREYFITVDNFSIWRRHLAWALTDGGDLRACLTQRFSSSMVFMSLLLGAELQVLFNSAKITTDMREKLRDQDHNELKFWIGMLIIVSVVLTLFSLISTFTAWAMVSVVSDSNAHCILRSSIGQYVVELPGRFIVSSIYVFLIWVMLFFFELLPLGFWSIILVASVLAGFVHIMIVFSAFGRIIMHTGAMGPQRIFSAQYEKRLLPRSLQNNLFTKAKAELANKTSITRQYRRKHNPIDREYSSDDMSERLSEREISDLIAEPPDQVRTRADSTVRFADQLWSSRPEDPHHHHLPHHHGPSAQGSALRSSSPLGLIHSLSEGTTETNNAGSNALEVSGNNSSNVPQRLPMYGSNNSGSGGKPGDITSSNGGQPRPPRRPAPPGNPLRSQSSKSLDEWLNGGTDTSSPASAETTEKMQLPPVPFAPPVPTYGRDKPQRPQPSRLPRSSLSRNTSDNSGSNFPLRTIGHHTRVSSIVSSIAGSEDEDARDLDARRTERQHGGSFDALFDPEDPDAPILPAGAEQQQANNDMTRTPRRSPPPPPLPTTVVSDSTQVPPTSPLAHPTTPVRTLRAALATQTVEEDEEDLESLMAERQGLLSNEGAQAFNDYSSMKAKRGGF